MSAERDAPLRLLQVHAHPDDEASKGAATMARYADEGVRGILVCCTGGEEGEILNPEMDLPEVREDITAVRRAVFVMKGGKVYENVPRGSKAPEAKRLSSSGQ